MIPILWQGKQSVMRGEKKMNSYDVIVIGGGPAGLAAAISAEKEGAKTIVIERERKVGGVLKQCIHDGFGLQTFKERLTGPEYAHKYIEMIKERDIEVVTSTYVLKIEKQGDVFDVTLVNGANAVYTIKGKTIVLANGCRERTAKQIFINGTRPAGVLTAGTAQYIVNIMGYMPCKKCVVLGSGDIGLIMARRLTLEGCEVVGVYEAKSTPSGLTRNLIQCLDDFHIPLHLSHTVIEVIGEDRVQGVKVCEVDDKMQPIKDTETFISCDGVILSVGLIPENELAESLNVPMDNRTKGPLVDESFMTMQEGIFSCGNALHVNDLVDYVSESGNLCGYNAAAYAKKSENRELKDLKYDKKKFLYVVPQNINLSSANKEATIYFRALKEERNSIIRVISGGEVVLEKKFTSLKPPEMEKIKFDIESISKQETLEIIMVEGEK